MNRTHFFLWLWVLIGPVGPVQGAPSNEELRRFHEAILVQKINLEKDLSSREKTIRTKETEALKRQNRKMSDLHLALQKDLGSLSPEDQNNRIASYQKDLLTLKQNSKKEQNTFDKERDDIRNKRSEYQRDFAKKIADLNSR